MLSSYRPTSRQLRLSCLAALVANVAIVITGGAVRLTGSGLGCPTFPRCTAESMTPTREMGVHGVIEFGNRMLTFALGAAVVVAIVVTMRAQPRRPILIVLSWLLLAGIVAQALLGGVTVLTGLHPVTVMAHFLLSMALIAVAVVLYERSGEPDDPARPVAHPAVRLLGTVLIGVTTMTLVLGTVVTGSGPHSGDENAQHRLPFSPATVAQLHAEGVLLLLGLTITLLFALRATGAPQLVRNRARDLFTITLAQGFLGYAQYFTKLPILLVGLHLLGACLVWIAVSRLYLATRTRESVPVAMAQGQAMTLR